MKLFLCRPYWRHLFEPFPKGLVHQVHKWTVGIVLVEHTEPDGRLASEHHEGHILYPR